MGLIRALRQLGLLLFGRLSFCALMGGLAGAICGLLFAVIQTGHAPGIFTNQALLYIGLMLGLTAFVLLLLIVGGFCRYGVRAIFVGALLISLVTGVVTTFVSERVGISTITAIVGLLVGIVVGSIFCRFYCWRRRD
jgi:hypothetical protein